MLFAGHLEKHSHGKKEAGELITATGRPGLVFGLEKGQAGRDTALEGCSAPKWTFKDARKRLRFQDASLKKTARIKQNPSHVLTLIN